MSSVASALAAQDFDTVVSEVRDWIATDRRAAFSDPAVKRWLALRWKDLFLREAVRDPDTVRRAGQPAGLAMLTRNPLAKDQRSDRQKVCERFLKGTTDEDWRTELPEPAALGPLRTHLLLCPGMLAGLLHPGAFPFVAEAPAIEAGRGWRTLRADLHPLRGCEANGADLIAALDEGRGSLADMRPVERPVPPGKVWIVAHSKAGPDVLTFLVNHPEYADRIAGIYTWAGAMGGSYTADTIYEQIKNLDTQAISDRLYDLLQLVSPAIVERTGLRRVDECDVKGAFHDLRTSVREQYAKDHADEINSLGVPFFNLTGATTPLEVPNFQFADTVRMSQYDANNDMQLTQAQATMDNPIATHVAMLHGHHWDIAYDAFPLRMRAMSPNLDHPFPKEAALVACWQQMAELGLID